MNFYGKLRQQYNQGPSRQHQFEVRQSVANKVPKNRKIEQRMQNKEQHKKRKVIIVGAGFGGLYSAWLLKQGGYEVVVLESNHEVGGRVNSNHDFAQGRVVEFGAEFIGVCHKNWVQMAKHFGLSLNSITSDDNYSSMNLESRFIFKDKVVSGKEFEKLFSEIENIYVKISEEAKQVQFPSTPWLDSKEVQELDNVSLGEKFDEWNKNGIVTLSKDAREILDFMFENDNVSSVYEQSYLGLLCQVKGGSEAIGVTTENFWDNVENFRCAEGNQALALKFQEELGKDVRLNTFVNEIKVKGEQVTVKTKTGEKFVGDLIILAVPPTVYKDINITPALNLSDYTPGMGDAMKIFNSIDRRFWIKLGLAPGNYTVGLGQTWESTEGQSISKNQKLVLSVFTGGEHVKKVDPHENKEKTVKYIREEICRTFGIKDFDSHCDKTDFSLHHRKEFVHTGYSFGKKGFLKVTQNLNTPALGGKLYFVGEASSIEFTGYMEGALRSAYLTVKNILGVTKQKKSVPQVHKN